MATSSKAKPAAAKAAAKTEPKTEEKPKAEEAGDTLVDVTYDGVQHVEHELSGLGFDPGQTHRMTQLLAADLVLRGGGLFTVREASDEQPAPEPDSADDEVVEVEYLGGQRARVDGREYRRGDRVKLGRADARRKFLHLQYTFREVPQGKARG